MGDLGKHRPDLSDREFDSARLDLLRIRVKWFSLALGIFVLLLAAIQAVIVYTILDPANRPTLAGVSIGALLGLVIVIFPLRRQSGIDQMSLRKLVWRTLLLVLVAVLSQVIGAAVLARGITDLLRPLGFGGNIGPLFPLVIILGIAHLTAVLIFPWTALEACVPPLGICLLSILVSTILDNDSRNFQLVGAILPLVAGLPGIAIAAFRSNSLRTLLGLRLIGARYAEVERELTFARRVHERLFPPHVSTGPLRMTFRYEPMMQLGGDYLDATTHPDGSLTLTLIDVTGHGFAAALAVNRLHGELKRIAAHNPDSSPAAVIAALNDYIYLTLADEHVFATAVALRADSAGRCSLCSAGHPPAMLRRADGTVEPIESTSAMLGLFAAHDFAAENVLTQLNLGDCLILYTDGAIEVRDIDGRQLGIKGMRDVISRSKAQSESADQVVERVIAAVTNHRGNIAEDDTLIVVVTRADPVASSQQ